MAERTRRGQLGRVQKELSEWRGQYGGRGRPIPEELWCAAAEVAAVEGVDVTARALGVDRERLSRRVARSCAPLADAPKQTALSKAFVEVDAQRVFSRGQVLVRLMGRDGEQVEFAFDAGTVDVAAVAQTFWSRVR